MNRNARLAAVVAIALVCASIASYAVYHLYSTKLVSAGPRLALTIVAAHPIPAGTLVTRDLVKVIAWPAESQVPGSFSDVRQVIDRGAIDSIAMNEPLTDAKLAAVGAGAGLPPTIPPGMRAMSVKVNEVIGVAGFVVPGTRVDVLVTLDGGSDGAESLARVVVSNVQVLTAGTRFDQEKARQDARPIPTSVVTLLVSPEDAERLTLAQNQGRITLTLRNPLDTLPTETSGARMAALMGSAPKPVAAAPSVPRPRPAPAVVAPPPPEPPKPYTVEAIRGAKRTEEQVKSNGEETIKE
jgi:pilus assembly protein CpaB